MAFDMLEAMTLIAREKNIDFEAVVQSLEASLLAAAKKKYANTDNISFRFDRKNNELFMIVTRKVVDKVAQPDLEISLAEAKKIDEAAELGDELELYLDYEAEFGRNAISSAKQILIQKIRDVEHERIYEEYIDKVGTLVTGVVQQIDKGNVIVNLGRGEAVLPSKEQIPREKFRQGDRVRALIQDVQMTPRGPQITLSRVNNDFLLGLFAMEVPEIYEKVIEIKAIAREPGERAKIAVYSSDDRIDPVGACVGMRGSRVQAVSNELNGERVDIILWDENPAQFVINAMSPADVVSIVIDEEARSMDVAVKEENLAQAIGRFGQNVRLATQLSGWELNVMNEKDAAAKSEQEARRSAQVFMDQLGIDEGLATLLVEEGFSSVDEVAYVPLEEMRAIDELDEETIELLRERASDVLVTRAIATEEVDEVGGLSLSALEGMDETLVEVLAERGIETLDDLADLAVDDLMEIEGMDEERAARLIMQAREPMFANAPEE